MAQNAKGKSGSKQGDSTKVRRKAQLAALREATVALQHRRTVLADAQKRVGMLESVSLGLYEELDKLTKKAPAEAVTALVLEQTNEIIHEAREVAVDDAYVQRLREFVPAGDLPEQRDVLVVLRQVRQGLERFASATKTESDRLNKLIFEARTVDFALEYYLQYDMIPDHDMTEKSGINPASYWFHGSFGSSKFAFEKLDRTEIGQYFGVVAE